MILVVGATGLVGSKVCRRLAERGEQVRALVRASSAPEKLAALRDRGAELCVGDLKDARSLAEACRGAEAVISTASSTFSRQEGDSIASVDGAGQLQLVAAARAAGVERFVFVSFRHSEGASFPLAEAKAAVEHAIVDRRYTIIQASFFMEAWLSPALGFDYANARARIYGPGTGRISWVSYADVAEMCVVALRHPAAERRIIEFGGPEALTPLETVKQFELAGGRPFTLEHVPAELLQAQFAGAGDPMSNSFAALMLGYLAGDAMDMSGVPAEFGIELTSVDAYARRVLAMPVEVA